MREARIRQRVRETIEAMLEKELTAALGAARSDRLGPRGTGIAWDARATCTDGPRAV